MIPTDDFSLFTRGMPSAPANEPDLANVVLELHQALERIDQRTDRGAAKAEGIKLALSLLTEC